MRYAIFSVLFLILTSFAASIGHASEPWPQIVVVAEDASFKPDDLDDVSLQYSKKNEVMILKLKLNDSGKKKFERILKGNKGKKIALLDGNAVVMAPVYINTESSLDHLDIYLDESTSALELLKKLSK